MSRKRAILLAGAGLLALALGFGCSLLGREETGEVLGYSIKLRIQAPPAGKGITVGELDVSGLHIEVLDQAEVALASIDWAEAEGPLEYSLPVPQPGEYRIVVTHLGGSEEAPVQATEEAVFEIRAMKITVIDIVPGCIGVIHVTPGQVVEPQPGTITGRLAGADAFNGLDGSFLVFPAGAEISPDTVLGAGLLLIVEGSAEGIVKESIDAVDPIVFAAGGFYDLYAHIDLDGDDLPTKGDWWAGPKTVQVDGHLVVDFTFPQDFAELAEGLPFTWQLYGTWINEAYDEIEEGGSPSKLIYYESGLLEVYDDLEPDSTPFATLPYEITKEWAAGQAHWYQIVEHMGVELIYATARISDGGSTLEGLSSAEDYPDPVLLDPAAESYMIYYRQE